MISKKNKRIFLKTIILITCILIITRLFVLVLAKYESISNSNANVDVAFYLLKDDYKKMTTNLDSILPRDDVYVYTFSIGNEDGKQKAEVDLEYELKIRTTTNLPLTYELYMNQKYTDSGAKNIIKKNNIALDEDGTYFRTITTNNEKLPYKEGKTNLYQLVIHFPKQYDTENYQNIIELIEITVNAHQITGKENK